MRVNIKYTIKENFIASKGNKSDLHLGEFGGKFATLMKFWNEKQRWLDAAAENSLNFVDNEEWDDGGWGRPPLVHQ